MDDRVCSLEDLIAKLEERIENRNSLITTADIQDENRQLRTAIEELQDELKAQNSLIQDIQKAFSDALKQMENKTCYEGDRASWAYSHLPQNLTLLLSFVFILYI